MQVIRRGRFASDATDIYASLATNSPQAADRFLDELELLIDLLRAFPRAGRAREDLRAGVRSFRVRGFSHILYYRLRHDAIVLLRVIHSARRVRPGMV